MKEGEERIVYHSLKRKMADASPPLEKLKKTIANECATNKPNLI